MYLGGHKISDVTTLYQVYILNVITWAKEGYLSSRQNLRILNDNPETSILLMLLMCVDCACFPWGSDGGVFSFSRGMSRDRTCRRGLILRGCALLRSVVHSSHCVLLASIAHNGIVATVLLRAVATSLDVPSNTAAAREVLTRRYISTLATPQHIPHPSILPTAPKPCQTNPSCSSRCPFCPRKRSPRSTPGTLVLWHQHPRSRTSDWSCF